MSAYYEIFSCPGTEILKSIKIDGSKLQKITPFDRGTLRYPATFIYLRDILTKHNFIKYIKDPLELINDCARFPSTENRDHKNKTISSLFMGLWITNPSKPNKINSQIENFISQSKKLVGYTNIIWTNIDVSKFLAMNPSLEHENISIRNIAEIETEYQHLLDLIIHPTRYIHSSKIEFYNGVLIDIAKYLIIESLGGVIADLNFEFNKNFDQRILESYDFLAPTVQFPEIENGFFAAKPNHNIIKSTLDIISDILLGNTCSLLEFRDIISNETPTELISMMPLSMSYIAQNNLDGNIDALFPKFSNCPSEIIFISDSEEASIEEYIEQTDRMDSSYVMNVNVSFLSYQTFEEHINQADKMDSSNYIDVADYIVNYHRLASYSTNQKYSCVEQDIIGFDKNSYSWVDAGII